LNKKNQPYLLTFTDAKVAAIHEIADDGGYIVKMWIPEPSVDKIRTIDDFARQRSNDCNKEWFNNALSKEMLEEYFRPSIDDKQMCNTLVSTTKIPRSVVWCGEQHDDFEAIFRRDKRELRKMSCSCTLEIQGLYFYPKRFGVRWIIRNIEFFDPSSIHEDSEDDHSIIDRVDIETFWEDELNDVGKLLDEDIKQLKKKIDAVLEFKASLRNSLLIAKDQDSCNSLWDRNLEALKESIFQYKSGRL
jgi:hypothetical protein